MNPTSDNRQAAAPDSTAVRVALWRAMHVQVDAPPHVLEDQIGLKLVAPDDGWRQRPDMDPQFTRPFRASILAGRASSRIWSRQRQVGTSLNTSSLERVSIRSPSAGWRLRPA
jgi:hypothetical protein